MRQFPLWPVLIHVFGEKESKGILGPRGKEFHEYSSSGRFFKKKKIGWGKSIYVMR